jgi:hypothetical protein
MKPKLEADENANTSSSNRLSKALDMIQGVRDRFLDEQMTAGIGCRERDVEVERRWSSHNCACWIICKGSIDIGFGGYSRQLVIGQRTLVRAQENDISPAQGSEVSEVPAPHRPQAGYQDVP